MGPRIDLAVASLDWPVLKLIALKPLIRFAYFRRRPLLFRNFADQEERIDKGLVAFDIAADVGWDHVQATLRQYQILPETFFAGSAQHFARLRETVCAAV